MGTLNFKFELSGYVGILKIYSDLTPTSSEGFGEALKMSLNLADHVIVNLEKVKEFDLVCLKVLCSTYKRSKKLKKLLTPVARAMPSIKSKLESSGYCKYICKVPDHMNYGNYECLWVR
jgi:anti-anti-sigma regulatory factor